MNRHYFRIIQGNMSKSRSLKCLLPRQPHVSLNIWSYNVAVLRDWKCGKAFFFLLLLNIAAFPSRIFVGAEVTSLLTIPIWQFPTPHNSPTLITKNSPFLGHSEHFFFQQIVAAN